MGLGLLAVLSLLPADTIARIRISPRSEHVAAYAVTAIACGFAFGRGRHLPVLYLLLVLYAGGLEAAQTLSPGRHSALVDFFASSLGIALGGAVSWLLAKWTGSSSRSPLQLTDSDGASADGSDNRE